MKTLPPIDNEIRQAPRPKIDVALRPRPELPDEAIEANSRVIPPGL